MTFHPPLIVSPQTHPTLIAPSSQTTSNSTSTFPATSNEATTFSYDSVRQLTNQMEEQIKSGILDAPSWKYIRAAHTARRLYAPLGTKLGLGDYVRLTQRFVDVLANGKTAKSVFDESVSPLKTPMVSRKSFLNGNETTATTSTSEEDIKLLVEDLKVCPFSFLRFVLSPSFVSSLFFFFFFFRCILTSFRNCSDISRFALFTRN